MEAGLVTKVVLFIDNKGMEGPPVRAGCLWDGYIRAEREGEEGEHQDQPPISSVRRAGVSRELFFRRKI